MPSAGVVISSLTLSTLDKIFNRQHDEIFFLFSQKTECDICTKCHLLFSNYINLSSAELTKGVVKVNDY